jgi:hypothetical protein
VTKTATKRQVFKTFLLEVESSSTPLLLVCLKKTLAKGGFQPTFDVCKEAQLTTKAFNSQYSNKEGYLYKQGGNVKNWKSRWFVLRYVVGSRHAPTITDPL